MRTYRPLPSGDRIRELLSYDAKSGVLTWRVARHGAAKAGTTAGLRKGRGSIEVKVDGVRYQAHRLIWKMMTDADPKEQIDHRDCNPGNNAWSNLREATQSQNLLNRHCDPRSAVGLKGVTKARGTKRSRPMWKAQISTPGGMRYLGRHDSPEKAHAVWGAEAGKVFGAFTRKE